MALVTPCTGSRAVNTPAEGKKKKLSFMLILHELLNCCTIFSSTKSTILDRFSFLIIIKIKNLYKNVTKKLKKGKHSLSRRKQGSLYTD